MNKPDINEMNLYKSKSRFMKSFLSLKQELNRLPTIKELSKIDHLHYNGYQAVDYAIINTKTNANSTVLDIGSGIGGPARYIAHNTQAVVYAVELQEDLNEIGTILTRKYNLNTKVNHIKKDIHNFSTKEKKFDSVVSWLALYHIPHREKLFDKIFSLLKKEGYFFSEDFFLIDKISSKEKKSLAKDFYANHLVNYKKYLEELREKNFEIISHKNMTDNWLVFTKNRLSNYEKNFAQNIKLYGKVTADNVLNFYKLAFSLLNNKTIGGIRFLCKKKDF